MGTADTQIADTCDNPPVAGSNPTVYAICYFAYIIASMTRPLSLAQHTLYADLLDQGSDDLFDPDLPENGSLLVRGNRRGASAEHAYYQGYRLAAGDTARGQRYSRYLGRADDPVVAAMIARFQRIKAVRAERATTVRALIGAGMAKPNRMTGRIVEALARAGLFPEHAVLIGKVAYQTYDGILGVSLSKSRAEAALDRPDVEVAIRDREQLKDILNTLRSVDPSFDPKTPGSATYRSANGISFSVAHAARDSSVLTTFLIDRPARAIVLHGPGIPVTVPAPERYAAYAQVQQPPLLVGDNDELKAGLIYAGRGDAFAAFSAAAAALEAGSPP